uniref:Uncharacterized protein n=1 Tax=Mycolicibacterium gilvum (strain PYR-GCK) TaxID=350054 RepID=A4T2G6_MYCGI|nr:hypothetical protein Mflv_2661 [Mycolicibacterium gilvum PYR-GCK]
MAASIAAHEPPSPVDRRCGVRSALRDGRAADPVSARTGRRTRPHPGPASDLLGAGRRRRPRVRQGPARRPGGASVHHRIRGDGHAAVRIGLVHRGFGAAARTGDRRHGTGHRRCRRHVAARRDRREHPGGRADSAGRQRRRAAPLAGNRRRGLHRGTAHRDHHHHRSARQLHLPRRTDEPLPRRHADRGVLPGARSRARTPGPSRRPGAAQRLHRRPGDRDVRRRPGLAPIPFS